MKLKTKLIGCFTLFSIAGFSIIGFSFYIFFSIKIDSTIRNQLKELVAHAAMIIDPDDHAILVDNADEQSDIYKKCVQDLRLFRDASPDIAYIYTVRPIGDREMFVLDAEEDSVDKSRLGDIYDDAPQQVKTLSRECQYPVVDKDFFTDKWGTFLSGFAPIRTSDGRLDGIIGIDISLKTVQKAKLDILLWITSISLLLLCIAMITASRFANNIAAPIQIIDRELNRFSAGNLHKGDSNKFIHNKDEIGSLFRAKDSLQSSLTTFLDNINNAVITVASSALKLSTVSTQIASNAEGVSKQSSTVSSATSQITANINTISTIAKEISESVFSVVTAIKEMSVSFNEISLNCHKELQIAAEAKTHAASSKLVMDKLDASVKSIENVLNMINDIAEQTNLLSLNATIEAAHAGDAGMGFAVVANEVKDLANKTVQATADVKKRIDEMQENTMSAVTAIQAISGVIDSMNTISHTIVTAVEEQNSIVNQIAQNAAGVSAGAEKVSKNVSESAKGLSEISLTVSGVNSAIADTAKGTVHIKSSTDELANLSENLKTLLSQFKI